jgi:hypothetical protein
MPRSGFPAGALTADDRQIEFMPVPGYIQPPTETISVSNGSVTSFQGVYYLSAVTGSGGLNVILKPNSLSRSQLPVAERAQWRFLGEDDSHWRDSGDTANGLMTGIYLIECKPLAGRTTPPLASVVVENNDAVTLTLTYFIEAPPVGTAAAVVPFETASGSVGMPYAYVGQLRSRVGTSTGFVVKRRVVATAGHVVFDDGTLAAVTGLQWLFQRDRVSLEPVPQEPRGCYLFTGYSAQRVLENTPGTSSPQSQELDVAALYFNENASRGGFSGFLASDVVENELLLSNSNKILVGYPVDGIAASHQGRMHATPQEAGVFSVTVGATNDGGSAHATLFITCKPAISNQSPTISLGLPLNYQITSSESGVGVSYSAYGLPQGLAVDPASGLITGRPPATGVFPCLVSVSHRGASASALLTLTVTKTPLDDWRFINFGTYENTGPAADTADPDGDGQPNISEYAAATDPNNATDVFKVLASQISGAAFTITTSGKAGRTYSLQRSYDLPSGSWDTLASSAALASDGPVSLTDTAAPANNAFYRIQVTAP